jgi:hypothetical protein
VEQQHFAGTGAGGEVFWPGSGSGFVNLPKKSQKPNFFILKKVEFKH